MNILFIVFMVVGLLLTIGSFFLSKEEEESYSLEIGEEPKKDFGFKAEPKKETSANIEAIEAAKKKAREAVDKDYKFDLHLTDSSNQTVEELERDLLGGLDLNDEGKTADGKTAATVKPNTSSQNKNTGKKSGKKKNAPVNDRYEDLQFTDAAAEKEPKPEAPAKPAPAQNGSKPKSQTSKNNGKKGKKK